MGTSPASWGMVFGECLVDDFGAVQRPGGAPFNVAVHLRALGVGLGFCGRVGADPAATILAQRLPCLATDSWQRDACLPTGRVLVQAGADGGHQFQILPHQAYDAIALPDPLPEQIPWLYHGTLALRENGPSRQTWRQLARRAAWRIVDINLRAPWWTIDLVRELTAEADVLKLSGEELALLEGVLALPASPSMAERLGQLAAALRVGAVLLTQGLQGSAWWRAGGLWEQPALPVPQLCDTVGAGDAFTAGWLWAVLQGREPAAALAAGAQLAAAVCGTVGALPDTPEPYRQLSKP